MTESSHSHIADSNARQAAIDPSASFIVSAPAGSGKTGLLTLRVLNLLACVQKPEEILCITFTRKAAQEMSERIFSALRSASKRIANNEKMEALDDFSAALRHAAERALANDKKWNWRLLENPQRLSISTIDGFCKGLSNQLPLSSAMGTNVGVLENPVIVYQDAVSSWLTDAEKNDDAALKTLIKHLGGDVGTLQALLVQLLGVRDQWLPLVYSGIGHSHVEGASALRDKLEKIMLSWIESWIQLALPYFVRYEAELIDLSRYAERNFEQVPAFIKILAETDSFVNSGMQAPRYWRALIQFTTTKSTAQFRKKVDKRDGFPTGASKEEKTLAKLKKEQFLSILSELSDSGLNLDSLKILSNLPEPTYRDEQWQVLDALLNVLPRLAAYLTLEFTNHSSTDFLEFSLAATKALRPETGQIDLLQRLDYRIQHILIDEFQDTSQTQLELLQALTAEWQEDDGRSLFLVGDAMQSCYLFRNANVGIFLNIREHSLPNKALRALDLSVNFRSTTSIIHWVNRHFSAAFPQKNHADFGEVSYIPSEAFNQNTEDSYVNCKAYYLAPQFKEDDATNTSRNNHPVNAEAEYICEEIRRLLSTYPEKSIAVLVKSRSHVRAVIELFTDARIDYQAIEIDALESKRHIQDLISLAKILLSPLETLYWLACLRSPLCGLDHADLHHLFNIHACDHKNPTLRERIEAAIEKDVLSPAGTHRVQRFYRCYLRYADRMGRRNFSELLELFWIESGGPEQLSNEAELEDVHRFLTTLDDHEHQDQLDWDSFSRSLNRLFATPQSESSNPIQIMTMHKSKGLEFDTVFLPQLQRPPRPEDPALLYWLEREHHGEAEFLLSPMASKLETEVDLLSDFIRTQQKRKGQVEETRVFYVACTRARSRLYLSAILKFDEAKNEAVLPNKTCLLAKIWPTAESEFELVEVQTELRERSPMTSKHAIKVLPKTWRSPTFARLAAPKAQSHQFDNSGVDVYEEFKKNDHSAEFGRQFHQLLQAIGERSFDIHSVTADQCLAACQQFLRGSRLDPTLQSEWSRRFSSCVLKLRDDPTARWILNLDQQHSRASSELTVLERNSNSIRQHVIDRTFVDGQTRWVIDFKTAAPEPDQPLAEFEAIEVSQHEAQLMRYRDLMIKHDLNIEESKRPSSIKTALYFPFIQHLVVLEALTKAY